MEKLLTVISHDDFNSLIRNQNLLESEFNNHVTQVLKDDIINYFKDILGFDDVGCIMCLYKVNGRNIDIKKNYNNLNEYLEVASDCVILQFKANKPLMITMSFDDFLCINHKYDGELISHIGYDASDVIAFVPYIKLKDSKYFISLDENWGAVDMDVDPVNIGNVRRMDLC